MRRCYAKEFGLEKLSHPHDIIPQNTTDSGTSHVRYAAVTRYETCYPKYALPSKLATQRGFQHYGVSTGQAYVTTYCGYAWARSYTTVI